MFENTQKVSGFSNKIKTRASIRNLRQNFLQKNVSDTSEKKQYPVHYTKREVLGQKIKVKKII